MKILKITTAIIFILLLFQGYKYVNLLLSEKSEVSLMITDTQVSKELSEEEKNSRIEGLLKKDNEIKSSKRTTKITAMVLSLVFVLLNLLINNRRIQIEKRK